MVIHSTAKVTNPNSTGDRDAPFNVNNSAVLWKKVLHSIQFLRTWISLLNNTPSMCKNVLMLHHQHPQACYTYAITTEQEAQLLQKDHTTCHVS